MASKASRLVSLTFSNRSSWSSFLVKIEEQNFVKFQVGCQLMEYPSVLIKNQKFFSVFFLWFIFLHQTATYFIFGVWYLYSIVFEMGIITLGSDPWAGPGVRIVILMHLVIAPVGGQWFSWSFGGHAHGTCKIMIWLPEFIKLVLQTKAGTVKILHQIIIFFPNSVSDLNLLFNAPIIHFCNFGSQGSDFYHNIEEHI